MLSRLRAVITATLAVTTATAVITLAGAEPSHAASTAQIVTIAQANLGKGPCSTNSAGGSGYYTSCSEAWCADFAKWVWGQAGYSTAGLTPAAGSFPGYGLGFHSTPHVGDAIVFNYNGNGYADHVALVTQVNSNGTIYSIGGNERGGSGIVASDGAYSSAIGYSSYWGMNISGYVSPSGGSSGGGGSPGNAGASVTGIGPCNTSSAADCSAPAVGGGNDCFSGHFCIYTGPNFTGTVYSFYNCTHNGGDWALNNWNDVGSWINDNTGGAHAWIKDVNHNSLVNTSPWTNSSSYNFSPAWFIQAC
jgi:hypothetical protein